MEADARSPGLCSAFFFSPSNPEALASSPGAERRTVAPHRLIGAGEDRTEGPRSSLPAERRDKKALLFRPARSLGSLLSRFASQRDFKRVLVT